MAEDTPISAPDTAFPTSPELEKTFNQISPPEQQPTANPASIPQAMPDQPVNVVNPEGKLVSIPHSQLQEAMNAGYQQATDEHIQAHIRGEKYGTLPQQLITAAEGAGEAASFGLSTGLETAAGVKPEDIRARREENPGSHMVGQGAGLLASSLTGVGEAAALEKAGVATAKLVGLGAAEGAAAKIGSGAVKSAVENAMFQGGDEVSKMIAQNPDQTVGTAAADIGLAGLLGGGIGGSFASISPLWKATAGPKVASALKAISEKMGGIDGVVPDAMENALAKSGIELAPEIKAGLSNDPQVQTWFKTLEQSDTTKSGRAFQESYKKFKTDAGHSLIEALGKEPESALNMPELSKYERGKEIGHTLAEEFEAQTDPLSKEYDNFYNKFKGAELQPTREARLETLADEHARLSKELERATKRGVLSPQDGVKIKELQDAVADLNAKAQLPGTSDVIVDKVAQLANREGWTASPSSDIMREVNRVLTEVKGLKTLNDLGNYIKAVGDNMQGNPLNQPMVRAGGLVKKILRESEADLIGAHLGSEEGVNALNRFADVRKAYAAQSNLREAIDSRLHAGGSTHGYAKSIKAMAQTDGEALLRRLSGQGDADALQVLSKSFPHTAELVKQYHVDNILQTAINKAKPGEAINAGALLKAVNGLSPELKNFAIKPEAFEKIRAVEALLDEFNKLPHNFSNTARTVDKLMEFVPASAVGAVSLITSHNPVMSGALAYLTKTLGKDVPDATRLALLKFLGEGKQVSASGFKSMVEYINHTMRGEKLIGSAAKNVFKIGSKVLPESAMPSERAVKALDKQVRVAQTDPNELMKAGGDASHYLPDHGVAIGQTAARAVGYLNSVRPGSTQNAPLDTKLPASPAQKAAYDRALGIAQQPLVVLDRIKQGTITPADVTALKAMYPALYDRISHKLTEQMTETIGKGEIVPYKTRLGLSLFMGQALDSTMTPAGIMAAQPKPPQQEQQQPQGGGAPKGSPKALAKLPGMYQTPSQTRSAHAQKQ